jgi:hypothetical protein
VEKVHNIQKQMWNFDIEMETIRKNQLELVEIRNTVNRDEESLQSHK